jgi:lysophospholipase L1-like esterase
MISDAPTQIDPLNKRNSVLIVWEVLNDIFLGSTPEAAVANLERYCRGRRNTGWKILLLTCPATVNSGLAPKLAIADRIIRQNWRNYANGLLDVTAIPELANANRSDIYPDTVHLGARGYQILFEEANRCLRRLRR